mmetsp:Transcript_7261/g.5534  ORF Transcript_7261/g.5534 Transcript_7261/m.5534 type:complete len:125 (-) Transcript_7261:981-1355(-)
MHCPQDGLEKFEEISYLLKNREALRLEDFLNLADVRAHAVHDPVLAQITAPIIYKAQATFIKPPQEGQEQQEEEPQVDLTPCGFVPDLAADCELFAYAGIGFSDDDLVLLQKSLKTLAKNTGAS